MLKTHQRLTGTAGLLRDAVVRGAEARALEALLRLDAAVDLERDDAEARGLREEDRRALAEAPCFVFLGAITSESCGQASDVTTGQILAQAFANLQVEVHVVRQR